MFKRKKQAKSFSLSEDAVYFIKTYASEVINLDSPINEATLNDIINLAAQWEMDMIDPLSRDGRDKSSDYPEKKRNEAADRFVAEITGQWNDRTIPDLDNLNGRLGLM